jgi:DNA-binding IclR family transcriptional regulator
LYRYVEHTSGVGVLDKAVLVLDAVQGGAHSLAALTEVTGLSRATAHRLAVALEVHRFLAREGDGRWRPGPRLAASGTDTLLERAAPVLTRLRDLTGESAQLYRRQGDHRVCVAAADLGSGLRDTVPVGSALPMTAGSAAQVLLAFAAAEAPEGAAFTVFGPDGRLLGAVSVSGPLERLGRQPGRLHAAAVLTAAKELS